MLGHMLAFLVAGAVASAASIAALAGSVCMKRREGHAAWPLATYWGAVSAYMLCFTGLRLAHVFEWGGTATWFYAQTLAGASTLIALMYIMMAILAGSSMARWAAEGAAMAAFVTVFLIFHDGLVGPFIDAWSIEFLPVNGVARISVGVFYVVAPVALGGLVLWGVRGAEASLARRLRLFAVSVILIYVPNAGKYVVITGGPLATVLAVIMACGAVLGWLSYRDAGGNG